MPTMTAVAFANQTLTNAANATAAQTIVVGGVTYTWRAAVGATANEVLIGASAAASAQNLFDAINATAAVSGTTYGSATVKNPIVRATAVTATTVVVEALVPGAEGNSLASTSTTTSWTWGAGTLAGGSGSIWTALQEIRARGQFNADIELAFETINRAH